VSGRPLLDRLGLHRPELRAWALYDVANSAWMTTVLQIFPLFFVPVAVAAGLTEPQARAGFALGYLGGGMLLALNMLMIGSPQRFGIADAAAATRLSFLSVAVWSALFSIPLFRRVPEPARRLESEQRAGENPLRIATRRLGETFRELRHHRDAGLLLLSFLVYNDAINTIIRMAVTFGDEIGIPRGSLLGALLMVQFVGIPFAFAFGMLADRIGAKRAVFRALAVYGVISVYGYFLRTSTQFFVLAFLVGTVQGGAQALGRSLFATLIPKHKAGEMFGFFGVFDRFGGAMGALLLAGVDVERGRRLAREADAAAHPAVATAGA
jgi:UMF1 family MFS transporter